MADAVKPGDLEEKLKQAPIEAIHVEATDLSDGCGSKFDLLVISNVFEGELSPVLDTTTPVHNLETGLWTS
jgi:stress-induced morphogen